MKRASRLIALLVAAMACPATAQDSAAPGPVPDDPPATVRTGADAALRVTIPIRIDGKGPYDFVVDTGSQRTVISRELANELALADDRQVRVLSVSGLSDVPTVTVPSLAFGASRMEYVQAPVFAGEHLGASGMLGLDGLRHKRLVLDFRSGKMDITASAPQAPRGHDANTIVVEGQTKLGQLLLVDAAANGRKIRVILDTGAEVSIGNMALLRKLAKRDPRAFARTTVLTSVTGEQLTGQWGYVEEVRLGGVLFHRIPVVFADAGPFRELGLEDKPALLLGVSALRGFDRVAIDFGRKRVDFLLPDQGMRGDIELAALMAGDGARDPRGNINP